MKILLLSKDLNLKDQLESTGYFSSVQLEESFNKNSEDSDIVIISDQIISYNELIINIDGNKFLAGRKVYYMISNYNSKEIINNITWICQSKKIHAVPPKLTTSQIIEKIVSDLFPGSRKETTAVTFFGSDSKVGTSITAQAVAEDLAQNTSAKIAFIPLNCYRGTEYVKEESSIGMDNIKVKLLNNILSKEEVMNNCIQKDNLYILPGINSMLDARQFHPEHIQKLINLASECFNIIIVDAGSCKGLDFSAGMSIAALNAARHTYFVTTQQKIPFDIYEKTKIQILDMLQIKSEAFYLVLNKYYKTEGISTPDQLAKQYNMTLASYIPNLDYKGWEAEFNSSTLLGNDKDYDYEIKQLAKLIANQFEIRYIDNMVKKGFFENILKGKVFSWK